VGGGKGIWVEWEVSLIRGCTQGEACAVNMVKWGGRSEKKKLPNGGRGVSKSRKRKVSWLGDDRKKSAKKRLVPDRGQWGKGAEGTGKDAALE